MSAHPSDFGLAVAALWALAGPACAQVSLVQVPVVPVANLAPTPVSLPGPATQNDRFRAAMDQVFGAGAWRETSGYRSPAREDALRLVGAGVVAPGRLSRHSMGTPDAPGAYDAVVFGMPQARAAAMLRAADEGFARVFAEGAHGPEGPHLHIEVAGAALPSAPAAVIAPKGPSCDSIYERIVDGRPNPKLAHCSR